MSGLHDMMETGEAAAAERAPYQLKPLTAVNVGPTPYGHNVFCGEVHVAVIWRDSGSYAHPTTPQWRARSLMIGLNATVASFDLAMESVRDALQKYIGQFLA